MQVIYRMFYSETKQRQWYLIQIWNTSKCLFEFSSLKPRPNDRNMPTQHVATLLGVTCCRLATVLQDVAKCCWLKFDEPTTPNMSQHIATRWPNARNMLSPGQHRNMPTQHVATLLGATCCVRLATVLHVLRHVGCCWLKFDYFQNWANNTQHVATRWPNARNMCAQQCCDVLRWHVAIVWSGLYAQQCCDVVRWHVVIVWPGLKYWLGKHSKVGEIEIQSYFTSLTA